MRKVKRSEMNELFPVYPEITFRQVPIKGKKMSLFLQTYVNKGDYLVVHEMYRTFELKNSIYSYTSLFNDFRVKAEKIAKDDSINGYNLIKIEDYVNS